MIVSCQSCHKTLRVDAVRYAGKKIKIRCSVCSEVVVVDIPLDSTVAEQNTENFPLQIIVAHSDPALCETVGSILSRHGFCWRSCHTGDEALHEMDATPPHVAIIDVALPGLFAFEVVEKIRKRRGLENVKIMLLSSVYNKMAYKRRPHTLYGADDYIEKHHIPQELIDKIDKLLGRVSSPSAPAVTAQSQVPQEEDESIDELKDRLQRAEESEVARDPDEESARLKAQRLARIIASDISLYDEEKVAKGVQEGTFFELFAAEIAEGRQHFMARVPESLRDRAAILDSAFQDLIDRLRK